MAAHMSSRNISVSMENKINYLLHLCTVVHFVQIFCFGHEFDETFPCVARQFLAKVAQSPRFLLQKDHFMFRINANHRLLIILSQYH